MEPEEREEEQSKLMLINFQHLSLQLWSSFFLFFRPQPLKDLIYGKQNYLLSQCTCKWSVIAQQHWRKYTLNLNTKSGSITCLT